MAQVYGRNSVSKNNPLVENTQDKYRKRFRDTPIHLPTYAPLGSLTDGICLNTFRDGHIMTSWSNTFHIWMFGKYCSASFPLSRTAPASFGEVLLLYCMWFWQDKEVVCCFSPSGFDCFPLIFDFPLQARIWAASSPRCWSEVCWPSLSNQGIWWLFMALQGLKATFVFPSPSISP